MLPKDGSLSRRLTGNAGHENNEYEIAIYENDGPQPAVMMEMQLDTHAEIVTYFSAFCIFSNLFLTLHKLSAVPRIYTVSQKTSHL